MNGNKSREIFECSCPHCQHIRRFVVEALGKFTKCKSCGKLVCIQADVLVNKPEPDRRKRYAQSRDQSTPPSKDPNTPRHRDQVGQRVAVSCDRRECKSTRVASRVMVWLAVITAIAFFVATVAWVVAAVMAFNASGISGAVIGVIGMLLTATVGVFDVVLFMTWSDAVARISDDEVTAPCLAHNTHVQPHKVSLD